MAFAHKRIYLIPLDSRPVCYDMPRRLAAMAGLELCMPAPNLLGHLKTPANFKSLNRWVKNHLFENYPVIVALDTIAYGGLIPSRINTDPLSTLQDRIDSFFNQVKADACYGFSSILRIPAYNNAEEEPGYWQQYGRTLYAYSEALHRIGSASAGDLPSDVLEDFLARRAKNHHLNEAYLRYVSNGYLDYLTYCQDDTGAYGLNVHEAELLAEQIARRKLDASAHIQTGADEVAACMLARWLVQQHSRPLKVYAAYSDEAGRAMVAKFDGLPIETVVQKAVNACAAKLTKRASDADLWLMVHTPGQRQGDHCAHEQAVVHETQWQAVLKQVDKAFQQQKRLAIADVAYANGSDPRLIDHLLTRYDDWTGLYGYAAWNTPGNAIGTAVAMGLIRLLAEKNKTFNREAFNQLMLIRLADDWLYQSTVRYQIRQDLNGASSQQPLDETLLNVLMANGLALLQSRLDMEGQVIHCRYPCNRTFEVEIGIR